MRLLVDRDAELRARGIAWRVTGVASRRLGWIADPNGLDPSLLTSANAITRENYPAGRAQSNNVREWLNAAKVDVLFEATSLNVENGQPALDHIRAALEHDAHAITANKGPVVFGYQDL